MALITEARRFRNHELAPAKIHPPTPQEMIEIARRKLVEATAEAEWAEEAVARNELQASFGELDAQIQVVEATATLAEHLEVDPPPLPPTDPTTAADASAAAQAEATAAYATSYLAGLLDQQGRLSDPVNIYLEDAFDMRDVAVANREAAIPLETRI